MTSSLIHPRTGRSLRFDKGQWSDAAGVRVVATAGIPWAFRDPEANLAEWKLRYAHYREALDREIDALAAELQTSDLLTGARTRLETLRRGKIDQKKSMDEALKPIELASGLKLEGYDALKVRLPLNQSFLGYYPNLFRDWSAWGETENASHAALCLDALGTATQTAAKPARMAVLGCGAGRLAYDLIGALAPSETLLVDIDPFLLMSAQRLFRGEMLHFIEFALQPLDPASVALKRELRAPAGPRSATFALGDALDPPIGTGSIDLLVLPWLLDVLPVPILPVLAQLNHLLADGGRILFFGPTGFAHRETRHNLTPAELAEAFTEAGFEADTTRSGELPYMSSPASALHRHERVTALCARKVRPSPVERAAVVRQPSWIENTAVPVPHLPQFPAFVAKNEIFNQVVVKIDGLQSIDALAATLAPEFHLPLDETRALLRNFLNQLFEEARFRAF